LAAGLVRTDNPVETDCRRSSLASVLGPFRTLSRKSHADNSLSACVTERCTVAVYPVNAQGYIEHDGLTGPARRPRFEERGIQGMDKTSLTVGLVIGLTAMVGLSAAASEQAPCDYAGCSWLATGTVTKMDGKTFYLLGKDNVVYTIDAGPAEVVFEDYTADCCSLRVGDTVRVYGTLSGPAAVRAARVRVFAREPAKPAAGGAGPQKEVKIIVEPEFAPPAPSTPDAQVPAVEANWHGRGLVTDVDYTGKTIKVRTSTGQFSINTRGARLVNGSTAIGLGMINQGDAVRITGGLVGLNEIQACEVRVVRTRSESENALPQKHISVVGIIQQIDYPSFTFSMTTISTPIVVLADADTHIHQQGKATAFMELRPGMRVRISAYGSLGTGYAAREIQIIGVSP